MTIAVCCMRIAPKRVNPPDALDSGVARSVAGGAVHCVAPVVHVTREAGPMLKTAERPTQSARIASIGSVFAARLAGR